MRGLPTLIRLARRRADEQRTALAEAERQTLLAREELAMHDAAATRETDRARGQAAEMALWTEWSRIHTRQKQQLELAINLLQRQEDKLRDSLRENFAEIKRLEIALETAERAALKIAHRKAEQMAEDAELRRQHGR